MNVSIENEGGAHLVRVLGDVDLETSPKLWTQLQEQLRVGSKVVVELSGVTYIDSSGVAVLIQGLKHAQKRGVGYTLRAPSARVRSVLELAQLSRLFEIEDPTGGA